MTLDQRGRLYFLGQSRPDSRGVLVRRVLRLAGDELTKAVGTHLSPDGQIACYPDGLLVVCDRVQVLERVDDMLDRVEAAVTPSWCVQLHIVAIGQSDIFKLGLENIPSLKLAAAFANGSTTVNARGGLEMALRVAADQSTSVVVGQPCFLMADGVEAEFSRTRRYPVEKSDIAYDHNVSSKSFEYMDVGLIVRVGLRERSQRSAFLTLDVELSDSDGERFGVPVRVSEKYSTQAVIESGGVYLVGSLERTEDRRSPATMLWWGYGREGARQTLFIWATARAVRGPYIGNSGRGAEDGVEDRPSRLPPVVADGDMG